VTTCCERCTGTDHVKEFFYNQFERRSGSERLCWDCRWPFIERRLHPELRDGGTEPEEPAESGGQSSLFDYESL